MEVVLVIQRNHQARRAQYDNLEPTFFMVFNGLCVKYVLLFRTTILAERSSVELQHHSTRRMVFVITYFLYIPQNHLLSFKNKK